MGYGFYVGANTMIVGCKSTCADTDYETSIGYAAGAGSRVVASEADSFAIGFRGDGVGAIAGFCEISNCALAVSAGAAYSGAAFCTGSSNGAGVNGALNQHLVDLANGLGTEAVSPADAYGAWYSNKVAATSRNANTGFAGSTGTFVPRVNGRLYQVARVTYSGTCTLTISAPTDSSGSAITPEDGTRMVVVLQAAAGTTITPSWNAIFAGAVVANVATGTSRRQEFMYHSGSSKWIDQTNGITVTGDLWV